MTPKPMAAWSKVSQVEAGHFDAGTAYASVDRHRLADDEPYIYRTHDGGKSWKRVTAGIPVGAFVNSVKEDPKQKGLLYAATELRVYVSFDDGDHWQSLEENMPVTSVRDILVHGDDLAVATYGRGFWVLDQMSPLREMAVNEKQIRSERAHLFAPGETYAAVIGGQNGTPLPHEDPQELNPPAGVLAYYELKSDTQKPLTVELLDASGRGAGLSGERHSSGADRYGGDHRAADLAAAGASARNHGGHASRGAKRGGAARIRGRPASGVRRPRHPRTPVIRRSRSLPVRMWRRRGQAGSGERGLQPGSYTVRLTVEGKTYTQPATVLADPRHLPSNAEAPDDGDDNH